MGGAALESQGQKFEMFRWTWLLTCCSSPLLSRVFSSHRRAYRAFLPLSFLWESSNAWHVHDKREAGERKGEEETQLNPSSWVESARKREKWELPLLTVPVLQLTVPARSTGNTLQHSLQDASKDPKHNEVSLASAKEMATLLTKSLKTWRNALTWLSSRWVKQPDPPKPF